jgi:hypothetical protein
MKTTVCTLQLGLIVLGFAGCSTVRHDDPRYMPPWASQPVVKTPAVQRAPVTPAAYPVPAALYALTNIFRADGLPVLDNPQILLFDGTRAAAQSAPDTQQGAANCPVMLLVLDINKKVRQGRTFASGVAAIVRPQPRMRCQSCAAAV